MPFSSAEFDRNVRILLDIDGKEIDLIADLYCSQQACVKTVSDERNFITRLLHKDM